MGAASSKGTICARCKEMRKKFQQIKGGLPICRECYEYSSAKEANDLRKQVHELKALIARMKKEGFREDVSTLKPKVALTPPEERWDGYTH